MIYCDTSLLLSCFVGDRLSHLAVRQLERISDQDCAICWTLWHELEFTCALERMVGNPQRQTTRAEAQSIFSELRSWQSGGGVLEEKKVNWTQVFECSLKISKTHASRYQVRSLDIVHVALASQLKVKSFWSFDRRQRTLAQEIGISVNPWQEE